MRLFILPLTGLLILAAEFAPLQAQAGGPDDGVAFCDRTGQDLLASLEGGWSLTQGAGGVLAPVPMPLPPHDAVSVRFTYDAGEGIIDAQAADLSDGMILFPAGGPELEVAETYVQLGADEALASGCEWSETPILIGTNLYMTDVDGRYRSWFLDNEFCERELPEGEEEREEFFRIDLNRSRYGWCLERGPAPDIFQMEMTLVLRFQSPDYASGMVAFKGEADGYGFLAQAPVTMSRN